MTRRQARFAGLAAMLAALTLTPTSIAVSSPTQAPGTQAKQYAKYCGSKPKRVRGADTCVKAMKKLATGKSSTARSACAGLSRKRTKGERQSALARCVTAGSKLLKERKKARGNAGVVGEAGADDDTDDDSADPGDDPLDDGPLGEDLDATDMEIDAPDAD